MLSNTVCQFVTLISCIGTILSAYIAMKIFKMGTLSFLNKMFAFYFVFDAFQGCLQNYAMLPLFYERYRKTKDRNIDKPESKAQPKIQALTSKVSNLKGHHPTSRAFSAFSEEGPFRGGK